MNKEELKKQYPHLTELQGSYDHVGCGKNIRAELKKHFPTTKFSVRYESFSGGNAYRVSWDNGVTVPQVDEVVKKFGTRRFDGMTDSTYYESNEFNVLYGDVDWVTTSRHITQDGVKKAASILGVNEANYLTHHYEGQYAHEAVSFIDKNRNSTYYDEFMRHMALHMDLSDKAKAPIKAKVQAKVTKQDVISGMVQILPYSDKSFVVVGDTKRIKDELKKLGGRFNSHLTCGCGWVFKNADMVNVCNVLY